MKTRIDPAIELRREIEIQARLEEMRDRERELIASYGRWRAFLMFWFGWKPANVASDLDRPIRMSSD